MRYSSLDKIYIKFSSSGSSFIYLKLENFYSSYIIFHTIPYKE